MLAPQSPVLSVLLYLPCSVRSLGMHNKARQLNSFQSTLSVIWGVKGHPVLDSTIPLQFYVYSNVN